jgi:hypothetical protein
MKITRGRLRRLIREVLLQSTTLSTTDKMFGGDVPEGLRNEVREKLRSLMSEGRMTDAGDILNDLDCELPLSISCSRAIVSI